MAPDPQNIPEAIEIPEIETVVRLLRHGIRLADVKAAAPQIISRADHLFKRNFDENFQTIKRFKSPVCRGGFRDNVVSAKRDHAAAHNGERLEHGLAREQALTQLGDWEANPTTSFIRFAARESRSVIGAVALYNMRPVSVRPSTTRWSAMFASGILGQSSGTFQEIWIDALAAMFRARLVDTEGRTHRITRVRCPVDNPNHHWTEDLVSDLIRNHSFPMTYTKTSAGVLTGVTPAA